MGTLEWLLASMPVESTGAESCLQKNGLTLHYAQLRVRDTTASTFHMPLHV